MRSKVAGQIGVFAGLYTALVIVFHPISFMQVQCRVADMLSGIVPVFGWGAILGLTLGVLIANTTSPLGVLDLLSAIPSFVGYLIIWKLRNVSVLLGLTINAVIISVWVGFLLYLVLGLPFLVSALYVFIGMMIANTFGGYIVYKALNKLNL